MALSADDGATGAAASAEDLAEASEADRVEGAAVSVEEAEEPVGSIAVSGGGNLTIDQSRSRRYHTQQGNELRRE